MSKLPRITGKKMVNALKRAGFETIRIEGSHYHLYRHDKGLVTIPVHTGEILSPRLMKNILRQAGLQPAELTQLL
jgi:predicted RNA binding protein YcfA (HicA-like mRNA interferase family)